MAFYQFSVPTKILFEAGISQNFAHEVGLLGLKSVFAVTDAYLYKSGLCLPIFKHLEESGISVTGIFSDVPPDSSVKTVEACAQAAKESGAQGFLAIGGGSVMDTAKGATILFTLGGDLKNDYAGAQTITEDLAPLIAIPTTAGTGSEVTEAIVIYDDATHTKLSFVDAHLLPRLAVLDPELTLKLPPFLTAATGLDALTHAIEAIMSVQNNPVSDALATQAVRLIFKNLSRVVAHGDDVEARGQILVAANLAGMAFNHSMVGVVHAVAHSVGALARVHHGIANGIFLPYGMEYNLAAATNRIAMLANECGVQSGDSNEITACTVIRAVKMLLKKLNVACGFPLTYAAAGVKKEQLTQICELATEDGASFYNPRPVMVEDLLPFVERCWDTP
jgi:alcohol dehydrogenase class IV